MADTMGRPAKAPKKKKALAFLSSTPKPAPSSGDDPFGDKNESAEARGREDEDEDSLDLFRRSKDFFPVVIKEQEEKPRASTPETTDDRKHAVADQDDDPTPPSTRSSKRRRLSSPHSVTKHAVPDRYKELYGPATPPRHLSRSPTPRSRMSPTKNSKAVSSRPAKQATPAWLAAEEKGQAELVQSDISSAPRRSNSHQLSSHDVVLLDGDDDDGGDPFEKAPTVVTRTSSDAPKRRPEPAEEHESPPDVIDVPDSDDDIIETDFKPKEDELAFFITRAAQMEAAAKAATAALVPSDESDEPFSRGEEVSAPDAARTRLKKREPLIAIKIFIEPRLPSDALLQRTFGVKRGLSQDLGLVRQGFIQWARKLGMDISEEMERDIFLTWKGRRIYDSATGVSLGWQPTAAGEFPQRADGFGRGGVLLEAWTAESFERHKADQERRRMIDRGEIAAVNGAAGDNQSEGDAQEEQEPEVPKIKLSLVEKNKEPLKLTVYADTAIRILMGAYKKQRKVPDGLEIRLQFEGEWLAPNMTVGDAEIDDMCTIEVYLR